MKIRFAVASAILVFSTLAASAQYGRGDTIPMRDGSTIVTVGGCLVQYGARRERINNAQRCSENDIRDADQIMSGGGRPVFAVGSAAIRASAAASRQGPGHSPAVAATCAQTSSGRSAVLATAAGTPPSWTCAIARQAKRKTATARWSAGDLSERGRRVSLLNWAKLAG
jgi:hypothetical protein